SSRAGTQHVGEVAAVGGSPGTRAHGADTKSCSDPKQGIRATGFAFACCPCRAPEPSVGVEHVSMVVHGTGTIRGCPNLACVVLIVEVCVRDIFFAGG